MIGTHGSHGCSRVATRSCECRLLMSRTTSPLSSIGWPPQSPTIPRSDAPAWAFGMLFACNAARPSLKGDPNETIRPHGKAARYQAGQRMELEAYLRKDRRLL